MLAEYLKIPHLSVGDFLRKRALAKDQFAEHLNKIMTNGELLDTADTIKIIKEHLDQIDISQGFVLDGFPRNLEQAIAYQKFLNEYGISHNIVIHIEITKEEALSRLNGRYTCSNCGITYNTTDLALAPKKTGICDQCGSLLNQRLDDNVDSLNKRYDLYYQSTEPLISYYEILSVPMLKLSGHLGKEAITESIISYFKDNKYD